VRPVMTYCSTFTSALVAACLLTGCGKPPGGPPPAQGTPTVGVIRVQPQHVVLTTQLPGRTSAYLVAEVRPQVGGIVKTRLFKEGSDVKAGQPLYQIDPATYKATYDGDNASLANLIKQTAAQDDPYADWAIVQLEEKLMQAKTGMLELTQQLDRIRQDLPTQIDMGDNLNIHPVTLPLYIGSQLGFLAVYLLTDYDTLVRRTLLCWSKAARYEMSGKTAKTTPG